MSPSSADSFPHPAHPSPGPKAGIVRYSLHALLAEIAEERLPGANGFEKLPQSEIAKVFKAQTLRRRAASQ